MNKFNYKWYLKDGYPSKGIEKNNLNVFGTFICGGGSSMGYKLSGFNHLGGVEIDNQVAKIYRLNHNPKYLYNMDIRQFNKIEDLPKELYNLDILDGSPPCSTFSMAGSREKAWGKDKKFREGQVKQTLDDLVFVYLDTIEKLKPKVALLENVKGLMQGNAKGYLKEIYKRFTNIGYNVQVFCLNAAEMGVPQKRERVFIIGSQKCLRFPKLKLKFNEKAILFKNVEDKNAKRKLETGPQYLKYLKLTKPGDSLSKNHPKGNFFTAIRLNFNKVCNTIASGSKLYHPVGEYFLTNNELKLIGSYPIDYNFGKLKPQYLIGMSVPPVMIAQISHQIYKQWFR